nr:prolyl oligopeptidase family serine peptidase [Gemmatimonadaceae bacterium]
GAIALTALTQPAAAQQSGFDFSIKNIMRGPELYGRPPQQVRWSADGRWIYFTWNEPGAKFNETRKPYRVRAVPGAKPERLSIAQADTAGPMFARGSRSNDGAMTVVEYNGDLFINDMRAGTTRRLTATLAREANPKFSVDGRTVFFIRDNNVFSLNVANTSIRQLTDIRLAAAQRDSVKPTGILGRLEQQQRDLFEAIRDRSIADSTARADRRAREALGLKTYYLGRNEQVDGIAVSPSGNALLIYTHASVEGVRTAEVPQYVTGSGYVENLKIRDYVGDTQETNRIAFIALPSGNLTWLKPYPADTTTGYLSQASWNNAGSAAVFSSYTYDNKTRLIQTIDAATGAIKTLDRQFDSAWVLGASGFGPCDTCLGWYDQSRRVWFTSERDGYSHLYTANADGSERRQLTSGKWEVLDVQLSNDEKTFFVHTNEGSPFEEHLYRMPVNGGAREKITSASGRHVVTISPNESLGADIHSYVNRPPELFLITMRPGSSMSQLTSSPSAEWKSFKWIVPEIVQVPASDGLMVPAHIYRPADMGAQPNGAAVIFVHGAGYLHNVGNFWSEYPREYMFNQFLASKGYVVLDLDYRASSGYGRDWRTAIYRYMGGRDLQDQVDASSYLQKNFSINPERIGLYGGSYGGFITLMALFTQPKMFGAGAALRSVTDWAHYNHGYTSPILNFPQTDTLAYRRSSPIYFAEGLEDPLLMAHGMVDTNVFFQDIVRLSQRLIELGKKDWELAAYPVEDHAFIRPSSWTDEYRRIFELFERHLPERVPLKVKTP